MPKSKSNNLTTMSTIEEIKVVVVGELHIFM